VVRAVQCSGAVQCSDGTVQYWRSALVEAVTRLVATARASDPVSTVQVQYTVQIQYSAVQFSVAQCNAVAVQCSAVQSSAVVVRAVQGSAAQCRNAVLWWHSAVEVKCIAVHYSAVQWWCSGGAVQFSAVQLYFAQSSALQCSAEKYSAVV
jgi:hypothetical protein